MLMEWKYGVKLVNWLWKAVSLPGHWPRLQAKLPCAAPRHGSPLPTGNGLSQVLVAL